MFIAMPQVIICSSPGSVHVHRHAPGIHMFLSR
jgi:hypothetical protein